MKRELVSDIDRLRLAIDNWGLALVNEMQLLREAIVAINIDRKTENSSENPNNCEDEFFREPTAEERKAVADYIDSISVPTGVNVFDLMDEPQIVDWGKRKPCTLELFDDDGNYIEPKDEPQTDCSWK